jgi:adenylate kinase
MKLVLFGPPGAGKGTVAGKLSADMQIPHISTGDLFRSAVKNKTPLGIRVKEIMDSGSLVPDEITVDLVKDRLVDRDARDGFILDGFPRTVPQADALFAMSDIDVVLNFAIDDSILIARLSGRRVCVSCGYSHHIEFLPPKKTGICDRCGGKLIQREDDMVGSIKKRLEVYRIQTEPLITYYRKKNIISDIDAAPAPDVVYASVLKELTG